MKVALVVPGLDAPAGAGWGPQRFRLPLIAPAGPARLCFDFSSPCVELDYVG